MNRTAFFTDERTFWHTGGTHALFFPVGGWVQPPSSAGYAESPDSKRRFLSLVQASGRACQVSDGRLIGSSDTNKATYYEVACSGAAGFVLATDNTSGKYKEAIDCARATGLASGCTLTSATVTDAASIQRYTQLAAKAGYPCTIAKFRAIGESNGSDVVELA